MQKLESKPINLKNRVKKNPTQSLTNFPIQFQPWLMPVTADVGLMSFKLKIQIVHKRGGEKNMTKKLQKNSRHVFSSSLTQPPFLNHS